MKILVFSTDDHLYPAGGAESAMGEIMKRNSDIEFDLISARIRRGAKKYEKIGNTHIHRIGIGHPKVDGILLALFGHKKALRLHKERNFDLIWSIMASYGAFSAVRVKKAIQRPFVLTLQEGDDIEEILHKVRFVRTQFEEIFRYADALQPISNFLRNWGMQMGFRGKQLKVIPNGVDVSSFTKEFSVKELEDQKKSFGFPKDAHIVITSSRLEKKNGVGDVIDALPLLPEHVCFVICGDGSLMKQLRQKVKELKLEHRVRFLGFIPIETLPKLLKASDVFIRPSLTEGLGNSFLEAMAAEVITIGTPVGGIPDFLEDGVTGFLCTPQDKESIKEAISRAFSLDESEEQALKARAKKVVLETYDWDIIAKQMRALFDSF